MGKVAARHAPGSRERLIGRRAERATFRQALLNGVRVLHVHGPGGVGKSALLRTFARMCIESGARPAHLDARDVEPTASGLERAIAQALGFSPRGGVRRQLPRRRGRHVLFVDTYEHLAELDDWVREELVPGISSQVLTVLSGRNEPSPAWRTLAGWHGLPMRNLTPEESETFLRSRGVPAAKRRALIAFTRGHPLALALACEAAAQSPHISFAAGVSQNLVGALVEHLVAHAPSAQHKGALEACALARAMTEPLLAAMLDLPDARQIFDWLRAVSFVEPGPFGLYPHDLARDAIDAELRWRNPDRCAELIERAHAYYCARILHDPHSHRRTFNDVNFLSRHNPGARAIVWGEDPELVEDGVRPKDVPEIVAIVAAHEGAASAKLARHWLERQREHARVVRGSGGRVEGMLLNVYLDRARPEEIEADPGMRAIARYIARTAPLRPGDVANVFRFWMDRRAYQDPSAVHSMIGSMIMRHHFTTPRLGPAFMTVGNIELLEQMLASAGVPRHREAEFRVGRRDYAVFGMDFRRLSPAQWLSMLGRRSMRAVEGEFGPPPREEELVVLSRADFAAALREALRSLHGSELWQSPLLSSRLVRAEAPASASLEERAARLRSLLGDMVGELRAQPRLTAAADALVVTFLRSFERQEVAAERLGMAFSTYRRHLARGVEEITELLWQRELAGV